MVLSMPIKILFCSFKNKLFLCIELTLFHSRALTQKNIYHIFYKKHNEFKEEIPIPSQL